MRVVRHASLIACSIVVIGTLVDLDELEGCSTFVTATATVTGG